MKKLILCSILLFGLQLITAQEIEESIKITDIPFAIIENPPTFPGCTGTRQEKKSCLNRSIQKHVARNFNLKNVDSLGLSPGKQKIYIQFKINKNGNIDIVGTRAPHEKAKNEAIRIIKLLPKMVPGTQRGRNVNVMYMLPISFNVN